jgi:opacity protein-like surface antigen
VTFRHRPLLFAVILAGLVGVAATPAHGLDQRGLYLAIRGGGHFQTDGRLASGSPGFGGNPAVGLSVGVNLGRYLGAEIAGDLFEPNIELAGVGHIGDLGVGTLIPQVRLRYPVLEGRLTPYVLGGVGVAISQFNDRKPQAFGLDIRAGGTSVAGSLGAGIEYFVADNLAVGVESRLLLIGDHDLTVDGVSRPLRMTAVLATAGLRLLFPHAPAALRPDAPAAAGRVYLGLRYGGAVNVRPKATPGLELRPEHAAIVRPFNQLLGASVGIRLAHHVAVELALDGYEPNLAVPGVGQVGEYGIYALVPQVRLLYPLAEGRLVPYLLGGVGAGRAEFNDPRPENQIAGVDGSDWSVIGALGAGIDYFVADNIAFGLESKYWISRGHRLVADGQARDVNLDAVLVSAGVRIFFGPRHARR